MEKKTVVLLGIYLEGIYPRGDMEVEANLLAPALLKTAVDADSEIADRYDVKVLNLPASMESCEVASLILAEKPTAVGFSCYIWNIDLMCLSAKHVRAQDDRVILFVGGPEVTYAPVNFLQTHPQMDFVVGGSGEQRFKDLLKNDLNPRKKPQVEGVTVRDLSGEITKIENTKTVLEDLSLVPSPYQSGAIDLNDGKRHCVFIETYRGCIFKCGYCMWMGEVGDKQLNLFPIEQILKDLEVIYNNPNVAAVVFTDACIFYTHERAKQITDTISKCKYKIPTVLTLDIAFMNEEAVAAMQQLELSHQKFHFGMQSINLETMRLMSRKIGPKLFKDRVEMLRRVDPGIELSLDLIYGLAGDNFDTFRQTVDFALSLSPIKLNMSPLVLLPGSTYWKEKEKHGFVYEHESPYLVHSNNTYSEADMAKTRKFVLGVIMLMYFPAMRDTVYAMTDEHVNRVIEQAVEDNNFVTKFDNQKIETLSSRVRLIERFIEKFEDKSKLMLDLGFLGGASQYSIRTLDYVRKSAMDAVAAPQNGLLAYEAMLELMVEIEQQDFDKDIVLGLSYYRALVGGNGQLGEIDALCFSVNDIERVKFGWVVSSEVDVDHEYDIHEVPKTEDGGVAAMC